MSTGALATAAHRLNCLEAVLPATAALMNAGLHPLLVEIARLHAAIEQLDERISEVRTDVTELMRSADPNERAPGG